MIKVGMQIHITDNCPYSCSHCYIDKKTNNMSMETVSNIFSQIQKLQKRNIFVNPIALTGGDPLCHPQWETIAKQFIDIGVNIKLLGTPKTLTNKTIKSIKQLGIDSFQMSLDGLREMHDSIRGQGTFNDTIDKLFFLINNGIIPRIMYTVSNNNCDNLIPLIEYLNSLNIPIIFGFDFCVSIGNAIENRFNVSQYNIKNVIISYYNKIKELYAQGTKLILCEKSHYINAYKYSSNSTMKALENEYSNIGGCSAGWSSVSILPNGDIYPCRRLPVLLGNINVDDLYRLYIHDEFMIKLRDRNSYELCSDCTKYKVCRGCPAVEYSIHGSLSPQKCDFYTKDSEYYPNDLSGSINEINKIEHNNINTEYAIDKYITNKDFLKCFILLKDPSNAELFSQAPEQWLKTKNFILNNEEINYLLCSYYRN